MLPARIQFRFLLLLAVQVVLVAQPEKSVLVVSAGSGDYLMGAGGTLAALIDEGYAVNVVQIGNDEKNSAGLSPAQTRLANNREMQNAARILGIKEVLILNHKSGELSQVSSNEIRNQLFALIRVYKPRIVFHPDPWIHYEPDWDQFWTARPAEEFSYGSGGLVGAEFTKMGLPPASVPETYYYAANRPYRPGEGGHNGAKFRPVDITKTFNRKAAAIEELNTANRRYARRGEATAGTRRQAKSVATGSRCGEYQSFDSRVCGRACGNNRAKAWLSLRRRVQLSRQGQCDT